MKKNIITLSIAYMFLLSMSSCKKDHTCLCTLKAGGSEHVTVKTKESQVDSECKKLGEGSSVYSSCAIDSH